VLLLGTRVGGWCCGALVDLWTSGRSFPRWRAVWEVCGLCRRECESVGVRLYLSVLG